MPHLPAGPTHRTVRHSAEVYTRLKGFVGKICTNLQKGAKTFSNCLPIFEINTDYFWPYSATGGLFYYGTVPNECAEIDIVKISDCILTCNSSDFIFFNCNSLRFLRYITNFVVNSSILSPDAAEGTCVLYSVAYNQTNQFK